MLAGFRVESIGPGVFFSFCSSVADMGRVLYRVCFNPDRHAGKVSSDPMKAVILLMSVQTALPRTTPHDPARLYIRRGSVSSRTGTELQWVHM